MLFFPFIAILIKENHSTMDIRNFNYKLGKLCPDLISYGMSSKKNFCGWTALIPIAVYREYIV
jgi:hypothetical protein